MNKTTFNDLNLSDNVLKGINRMEFEIPTEIQEKTIPLLQEGIDIIGQGQTGTGKTLAYGSVLLSNINSNEKSIKALILAPTRELAMQISEELHRIGFYTNLSIVCVYGGSDIEKQIRSVKKGAQIVVGTPGRVQDLIRKRVLKLQDVSYLVLDEADEMLNMGFVEDIENILKYTPDTKQTILFSATMPKSIKNIAKQYMNADYQHIQMKEKNTITTNISQYYIETKQQARFEVLCRILDSRKIENAIIFCKTKRNVDEVSNELKMRGYSAEALHGDFSQNQRTETLAQFKKGKIQLLVATDVAARGIDASLITHVINYELPQEDELYIHRIGRCGRANKVGEAYSIVTLREKEHLIRIVKKHYSSIEKMRIPSQKEIFEYQISSLLKDVETSVINDDLTPFIEIADTIHPKRKNEVIASLMSLHYKKSLGYVYKDKIESSRFTELIINCGTIDKVNANDIKQFIVKQSHIDESQIGLIELKRKNSIIEVDSQVISRVVKNCYKKKLNQRKIEIKIFDSDIMS